MTQQRNPLRFTRGFSRWLLFLLPLVLLTPACAPAASSLDAGLSEAALPSTEAERKLPLWEVSDGRNTVYLFGSIHLLRSEVYPLDQEFYDAFDEARVVAFEVDFDELMAAGPIFLQRGIYNDGRSLRDVLPSDLYSEVEDRAAELGLPSEAIASMKPWMLSLTLSSLILQAGGFEAASGIDLHFHERATQAGKVIVGLETTDDQLDVFDGLDEPAQVEMLRSTLDQLDGTVDQLEEATQSWQEGDSEGLAESFVESLGDQDELLERLLYERNRNWIPEIESLLASREPAVVIVGMGHLVGEGSVVELLMERGFEVTQVRAERPVPAGAR